MTEQDRNKIRLDEAVQKLKSQMASDQANKDDWKKAYLHKINLHKQSLNRTIVWPN